MQNQNDLRNLNKAYILYKRKFIKKNKLIKGFTKNRIQIAQFAQYYYKTAFQKSAEANWLLSSKKIQFDAKKIKSTFFDNRANYTKLLLEYKANCLSFENNVEFTVGEPTIFDRKQKININREKIYLYQKLALTKRFQKSFLSFRRNTRTRMLLFYAKRYKTILRNKKTYSTEGGAFFYPIIPPKGFSYTSCNNKAIT